MVVEGGTQVVLSYVHPDYLPTQRIVHLAANDYVWASDVALVPRIDSGRQCSAAASAGALEFPRFRGHSPKRPEA